MPFDSTVSTASAATVSQKVVAYTEESEKRQLKCIRPRPKCRWIIRVMYCLEYIFGCYALGELNGVAQ